MKSISQYISIVLTVQTATLNKIVSYAIVAFMDSKECDIAGSTVPLLRHVAGRTEIARFSPSLYQGTHNTLTSRIFTVGSGRNQIWEMPFNEAKHILGMLPFSCFMTFSDIMMGYHLIDQLQQNVQKWFLVSPSCRMTLAFRAIISQHISNTFRNHFLPFRVILYG